MTFPALKGSTLKAAGKLVFTAFGYKDKHSGALHSEIDLLAEVSPDPLENQAWSFQFTDNSKWHSQERTQKKGEKQARWKYRWLSIGWLGYEDFSREHGITYLAQGYLNM